MRADQQTQSQFISFAKLCTHGFCTRARSSTHARAVVCYVFAQRIIFLGRALCDRVIMIRGCANLSVFGYTSIYYNLYIRISRMTCVCHSLWADYNKKRTKLAQRQNS